MKYLFIPAVALMLSLGACSGAGEKADGTTDSDSVANKQDSVTNKQNGGDVNANGNTGSASNFDKTFEVANVVLPSKISDNVEVVSAEKSIDSYGYPNIEVTFKLLNTVDTSSLVGSTGQMWIYGTAQDENGKVVKTITPNYNEWRSEDSDGSKMKDFLEAKPGETITLSFSGSNGKDMSVETIPEGSNMETEFNKVKKLKLNLKK